MSIPRVKTWVAGEVLTANDLENEFNNLADNALTEPFTATQSLDLNGELLILDADGDSYLDTSTDDTIKVYAAGAEVFRVTANTVTLVSGSSMAMTAGDIAFTSGRTLLAKSGDVASVATITVPTTGNVFDLTGTTNITGWSTTQAGTTFRVRYTGAGLNLIYNATSHITPYATDYRLVTDEVFDLVSLGSGNYYMVPMSGANHLEPGTPFQWWGTTAPTGGLLCDATAINCTTYPALAKKLVPNAATLGNAGTSVGTFTVDAGTDVITRATHGLAVHDLVHVTTDAADLPLNLLINTVYYVLTVPTGDTLTLSATRGGATFDIGDAGTGTHTIHNKVNTPDARGRVWIGVDGSANRMTSASTNGTNADTLGGVGGTETHTLITAEMPAHTHVPIIRTASVNPTGYLDGGTFDGTPTNATEATTSTGGGGAHSNTQPWIAGGMAIRF